jgi:hypothetical protein
LRSSPTRTSLLPLVPLVLASAPLSLLPAGAGSAMLPELCDSESNTAVSG